MIRRLVAGLIVVGLAIGVWFVWPRDDTEPTPTTLPTAVDSTTSTPTLTTLGTTTTVPESTTSADSHVVTSVEEAEAILQELWFGWFEGIYNEDEKRIKEVVATQSMLDNARTAFSEMTFTSEPIPSGISLTDAELLRSDEACIAFWSGIEASFREGSSQGVQVVRWDGADWRLVSVWGQRNDLWSGDCEASLEPLS